MSSSSVDVSVVLPTYNERETVVAVLEAVLEALETNASVEAIVVDDDSPDGTGELVDQQYRDDDRVRTIIRRDDQGLSGAVLEGLLHARGRYCVVMDSDGQHPPAAAPALVQLLQDDEADVAIGSRHAPGGAIEGWSVGRRLTSAVASAAATGLVPSARATSDPMSGYFAVDRDVVNNDVLEECDPHGYKILLEVLSRTDGVDVAEFPITFRDRQGGRSKLTIDEVVRYLEHTVGLGLQERDVDVVVPQLVRALEFGVTAALAYVLLMIGLVVGDVDGAGGAALIGVAGGLLTLGLLRVIRTADSWEATTEGYAK